MDILNLDSPLISVPFECLSKSVRHSQKIANSELTTVSNAISEFTKKSQKENITPQQACESLDKVVKRLQGIKRKLEESKSNEDLYVSKLRARLDHLSAMPPSSNGSTSEEKRQWNAVRVDRIMCDHLLREGCFETATKLAERKGISPLVDTEVFLSAKKVVDGLRAHECKEALTWCSENKAKLKKNKSTFEFEIRLQEYIELVRMGKVQDAVSHARKHFAAWTATNMSQIQRAMGVLAYSKTGFGPYQDLFSPSRWDDLITQFERENRVIHGLTQTSTLNIALQAGLSALKTPFCYQPGNQNVGCPVCSQTIGRLATSLPYSHHIHSTLVCRISGELMNDENPPMVLPNGFVYSKKAITEMATRNRGMITCPRSGETFRLEEAKKAFIS